MDMTRRTWLGRLLAGAALLLLPKGAGAKKLAISIKKIKDLQDVGGWKVVKAGGKKIIFIRDGQSSIRALDPYCPHKQCIVDYDPKSKKIKCPCHNSIFALDGKLLAGPSPKGLTPYEAKLDGDRILVSVP